MDNEQLTQVVIIALVFGTLAFVLRAVVDGLVRYKALRGGVTPDIFLGVLEAEKAAKRLASLRWGLLATGEAIALLLVDRLALPVNSAAALALFFAGAGVALLLFFALTRRRAAA